MTIRKKILVKQHTTKILGITNEWPEVVNRRIDNTIAKRKRNQRDNDWVNTNPIALIRCTRLVYLSNNTHFVCTVFNKHKRKPKGQSRLQGYCHIGYTRLQGYCHIGYTRLQGYCHIRYTRLQGYCHIRYTRLRYNPMGRYRGKNLITRYQAFL